MLGLGCATLAVATLAVATDFSRNERHRSRPVLFHGSFGTTGELAPTETPGVLHNRIQGVGDIPELGVCTVVIEETADFRTEPPTGTQNWVMTFAGGDQLTASLSGPGYFDPTDPAFITGSLQGSITGGTGRYQDVTGQAAGTFAAHIDTAPGVFPASAHGTITLKGILRQKRHGH